MPTLFLVRHGETEWSRNGRHTGKTDLALTQAGRDQASALKLRMARGSFDHVLTSPMRRARETCTLAGLGVGASVDGDLSEWDYGAYEGRTSRDIRAEAPGWSVFEDGCPGGESPSQVSDRADRVIAGLKAGGGRIALFSHGQFGCALAARWIGLDVVASQHFALAAGSLSILGPKPGHPRIPAIIGWNIASLADVDGL
ncbi:histidine phosphatase family protein [Sphingomonas sp. IW22]|uniref:histidine phosphatase family protein n=1 Tax=Sphingomonas sp. IW22 TaxID=3242489 RepID=UPI00351FAAC6